MPVYRSLALSAVAAALVLSDTRAAFSTAQAPPVRWTDETPDAMVEDAVGRATATDATPRAQLAALATVAALSDRAGWGVARKAAERIGAVGQADVRGEAALLVRSLSGEEGSEGAAREEAKLGVVQAVGLLGPFRDTGGGLDAHDGPEAPGALVRRRPRALLVGHRTRSPGAPCRAAFARRRRRAARRVRLSAQGELHLGRDQAHGRDARRSSSCASRPPGRRGSCSTGPTSARDDAVHESRAVRPARRRGAGRAGSAPARGEGVRRRHRRRRARAPARDRRERRVAGRGHRERRPRRDEPARGASDRPRASPSNAISTPLERALAAAAPDVEAPDAGRGPSHARRRRRPAQPSRAGPARRARRRIDRRRPPGDGRVGRAERREPERRG